MLPARSRRPAGRPRRLDPRPRPPGRRLRPRVAATRSPTSSPTVSRSATTCPPSYVEFVFSMLNCDAVRGRRRLLSRLRDARQVRDASRPLAPVPTSIICGTEDKITSVGHSRKLHSRIPGSSLLECEGAGHMVILERHERGQRRARRPARRRPPSAGRRSDPATYAASGRRRPPTCSRSSSRRSAPGRRSTRRPTRCRRPRLGLPPAGGAAAGCSPRMRRPPGRLPGPRPAPGRPLPAPVRRGPRPPRATASRPRSSMPPTRPRSASTASSVAREELPETIGFWEWHGLPSSSHAPARTSSCAAGSQQSFDAPERRRRCALSGSGSAARCAAATSSCSPASSAPARRRSPRASASGLGVRGAVTSPTFVIARVHPSLVAGPGPGPRRRLPARWHRRARRPRPRHVPRRRGDGRRVGRRAGRGAGRPAAGDR